MTNLDHMAAHPISPLLAYANLAEFQPRRGRGEACFALEAKQASPLPRTAPFSLDCSGLLPILVHVIGVSRRRRRSSGVGVWCQRNTAIVILNLQRHNTKPS